MGVPLPPQRPGKRPARESYVGRLPSAGLRRRDEADVRDGTARPRRSLGETSRPARHLRRRDRRRRRSGRPHAGDLDPAGILRRRARRHAGPEPRPEILGLTDGRRDGAQARTDPRPAARRHRPARDRPCASGLAPRRRLAADDRKPRDGRLADAPARHRPRPEPIDLGRPPAAALGPLGPAEARGNLAGHGRCRQHDCRDRRPAVRTGKGPVDRDRWHMAMETPRRRRLSSSLLGTGGALGHVEQAGLGQRLRPLRPDPAANRGRRRRQDPGADRRRRPGRHPRPPDRRSNLQDRSRLARTLPNEAALVPLSAVAGQSRTFEGTAPALPVGTYAIRLDAPQLAEALHLDPAPEARLDVIARQTSEDVELSAGAIRSTDSPARPAAAFSTTTKPTSSPLCSAPGPRPSPASRRPRSGISPSP